MTYAKAALTGLIGGIAINLVWALQDVNYYAGITAGLVALAVTLGVLVKKMR
jgi:hypothetical protein